MSTTEYLLSSRDLVEQMKDERYLLFSVSVSCEVRINLRFEIPKDKLAFAISLLQCKTDLIRNGHVELPTVDGPLIITQSQFSSDYVMTHRHFMCKLYNSLCYSIFITLAHKIDANLFKDVSAIKSED
jgi:hypothetical protein